MKEAEFAKTNLILKVQSGSVLYGTESSESDLDYVGICIPPEEYTIGMYSFEQYQDNSKGSGVERRNTSTDYDFTIHSLKKFMLLARDNNPNILELLFSPIKNQIILNSAGHELLQNKQLFPSQKAFHTFCGYAHAQKNKLISKRIRLQSFQDALFKLEHFKQRGDEKLCEKLEIKGAANEDRVWKTYEKNSSIKIVEEDINKLISEYGSRTEYIRKYGFDTKFSSHLLRLLFLGEELLLTGEMIFPLKERNIILDVKMGKWKLDEVLKLSDELEKRIEDANKKTKLPHTTDIAPINKLLIKLTKEFWEYQTNLKS